MNLVVDIGNSRIKAAVFSEGRILERWTFEELRSESLEGIFRSYPDIGRSILSSTRDDNRATEEALRERMGCFLRFEATVPVPLHNMYSTPGTLGGDRLAAAVGAAGLFPGKNLLVVDFGTAITEDIVTDGGCYLGGSISPGLAMRFRALAEYTGRLPLLGLENCEPFSGCGVPSSTQDAITSGVAGGIVFEIAGRMAAYSEEYPGLVTIFTGGDASFFEKRFKNTIFANHDLVLRGLNTILDYNADRKESI